MIKIMAATVCLLVITSCATYAWKNSNVTDPAQLNINMAECVKESYVIVPVTPIQSPQQPNYLQPSTQYQTNYVFQGNNGTYLTGTATTKPQDDMWQKQAAYQSAKSAYDNQVNAISSARNRVFNACMIAKGWVYSKVENKK